MPPTSAALAAKREAAGKSLERKGSTSIGFYWSEPNENLARGLLVWAALDRHLQIPRLGFHGIREPGRHVVISATIEGRTA